VGDVGIAACDILEADDLRDGLILACQARWPALVFTPSFDRIFRPLTAITFGTGTDCGTPLVRLHT